VLNRTRILNMVLRSGTLGARFIFIFFLAKYLDPESVGYYGLFTATVGYFLYLVGLDFYTYTTREILKAPIEQRGQMLKGQAALSALLYAIAVPLAVWVLPQAGWSRDLLLWFFPILVFEHLNQEISRLLVALSEQITASLILFMRQGSWGLAIVGLMIADASMRQLQAVMACWLAAGVIAACLGLRKIRQLRLGGWHRPVDWQWVKTGAKLSLAFLLATLALRGVQTIDRYWLQSLTNIETVGAYVLFLSMAGTLMVFLDAGVFAFAYPELIDLHHKQRNAQAHRKVKQLLIHILLAAAAFGVISWLLLPYLLQWINKPLYVENMWLYPWLLLATVINALGMAPHYGLYAQRRDKAIIGSHIAAMVAFAMSVWLLSQTLPTLAVPLGLVIFFTVILVSKAAAYWAGEHGTDTTPTMPQHS
jgi:O-antigen/teichoic acid export membrane protein